MRPSQFSHTRTSSSPTTTIPQDSSSRTNSLAITGLPKEFFQPHLLVHLHTHFQSYGTINQWVPLPGFGRILVVYEDDEAAEKAKIHSDPIVLNATEDRQELALRVYRADPNPLIFDSVNPENQFLQPPVLERDIPTLPAGSPGNPTPLADDLITALKNLQLQQSHYRGSSVEVLMDATESGVSVVVEDCDFGVDKNHLAWEEEDNRMYGVTAPSRTKWDHSQLFAAMPPFGSSIPVSVF
ncbi:hypothetical protein L218DRAFT_923382 [Marasmius fiardii PR-910]|nr:hypothetical protein L218DRAFT_923382 [Marasmius fiardii PR-910]